MTTEPADLLPPLPDTVPCTHGECGAWARAIERFRRAEAGRGWARTTPVPSTAPLEDLGEEGAGQAAGAAEEGLLEEGEGVSDGLRVADLIATALSLFESPRRAEDRRFNRRCIRVLAAAGHRASVADMWFAWERVQALCLVARRLPHLAAALRLLGRAIKDVRAHALHVGRLDADLSRAAAQLPATARPYFRDAPDNRRAAEHLGTDPRAATADAASLPVAIMGSYRLELAARRWCDLGKWLQRMELRAGRLEAHLYGRAYRLDPNNKFIQRPARAPAAATAGAGAAQSSRARAPAPAPAATAATPAAAATTDKGAAPRSSFWPDFLDKEGVQYRADLDYLRQMTAMVERDAAWFARGSGRVPAAYRSAVATAMRARLPPPTPEERDGRVKQGDLRLLARVGGGLAVWWNDRAGDVTGMLGPAASPADAALYSAARDAQAPREEGTAEG